MVTRRDMIGLAAAGLAGSALESQCAITRSELALRGAMMGGGKKWQNPYVTDGLVAMWDGEWNAGGGVHDSTATVWKDLVGDCDMMSAGSPSWDALGARMDSSAAGFLTGETSIFDGPISDGMFSVELVCDIFTGHRNFCMFLWGGGAADQYFTQSTGYIKSDFLGLTSVCMPAGKSYSPFPARSMSDDSSSAYFATVSDGTNLYNHVRHRDVVGKSNGFAISLPIPYGRKIFAFARRASNNQQLVTTGERILSCRIYSRPLTDSEIDANYAVDAARFNI